MAKTRSTKNNIYRIFAIAAIAFVVLTAAIGSTMIIGSQKGDTINNIQTQYNIIK